MHQYWKKLLLIAAFLMLVCCPLSVRAEECDHYWEKQDWGEEKIDNTYHSVKYVCLYCHASKTEKEKHDWVIDDIESDADWGKTSTYHWNTYTCSICWAVKDGKKEKHKLVDKWECLEEATVTKKGTMYNRCKRCGSVEKEFAWKYGGKYCCDYDCDIPIVFRKTKTITINDATYLETIPAGTIVKVKFGNKTYTGKINKKGKAKIRIKNRPKYGKYKIRLYYNNKVIYKAWDYVWYARYLKKGMTKKQATWCMYTGKPVKKKKMSNKVTCWTYASGVKAYFKNNRIIRLEEPECLL